jgi:hypothetical protein
MNLFSQLIHVPKATVILGNQKGALAHMARDQVIAGGHTSRLVMFDPSDPEFVCGYNPLKANGLAIATHAKAVREAIRAAWGQSSFDVTAQLARFLFLSLYLARELELTLLEALRVMQPGSSLRRQLLPRLHNVHVRETLAYYDALPERRQEELAASTLARLESFILDPSIRRILTAQQRCLDLAQVLDHRRILIVNFEQYRPFRPDDCKLLSRLLINDLLGHVFERPPHKRTPVFLILDEAQTWLTEDLCSMLELGRELGFCVILAHQHPEQFLLEDGNTRLRDSVRDNVRTRVVFGGHSVATLRDLTPELLIDQYDPWTVKDEIRAPVFAPVESTRTSLTVSASLSRSRGISFPESETVTESQARTRTRSTGLAVGDHHAHGRSQARGVGFSSSWSRASSHATIQATGLAQASLQGMSTTDGEGTSLMSDGSTVLAYNATQSSGAHAAQARTASRMESVADSQGESQGEAESFSEAEAVHEMEGQSRTWQQGESEGQTDGSSRARSRGVTPSHGEEEGRSVSKSTAPFYEYEEREVVSSRTFLPEQEFLTLGLQKIREQPNRHFVIKVPGKPAVFARSPDYEPPALSSTQRIRARQRIFSLPCYARVEEIEEEEREQLGQFEQPATKKKRLVTKE